MTEAIIEHLWQSSWFALAAAILTLLFRRNRADIRFRLWLAASVKFLIPFPLLALLGRQLRWESAPTLHTLPKLSLIVDSFVQPAAFMQATQAAPVAHAHWSAWAVAATVWLLGVAVLLCVRVTQLRQLHAAVAASSPLHIEAPIPVRETRTALEPGVIGIFPSILLLPKGIATQLAPEQLDTIIAHELCHWSRKDNLTAAIHMLVETLFWFHPLVWWVGSRMLVERERACDENVIESGGDRQTYAEGILKVCRSYVEAPLPCAAGVSGGSLRKRIEDIMTNQVVKKLHAGKRTVLAAAAVAALVGPVAVGFAGGVDNMTAHTAPDGAADMRHYASAQWHFSLDVPSRWNEFPAVSSNSPFEVTRFLSTEGGTNALIVFRIPFGPKSSLIAAAASAQEHLATEGFSNFLTQQRTVGSHQVVTLDFSRPQNGGTWSSREYFIGDGTLMYVLGFGTTNDPSTLQELYDRMASSFTAGDSSG